MIAQIAPGVNLNVGLGAHNWSDFLEPKYIDWVFITKGSKLIVSVSL